MNHKSLVMLIVLGAAALALLVGGCALVVGSDRTSSREAAEMQARFEANLIAQQDYARLADRAISDLMAAADQQHRFEANLVSPTDYDRLMDEIWRRLYDANIIGASDYSRLADQTSGW